MSETQVSFVNEASEAQINRAVVAERSSELFSSLDYSNRGFEPRDRKVVVSPSAYDDRKVVYMTN